MLQWLNTQINRFQPELKFLDNKEAVPPDGYVPVLSDILIPSIIMALVLIAVRSIFDRYIVTPFGTYMGIKDTTITEMKYPNPVLEAEYKIYKDIKTDSVLLNLTKKTAMTERQVQIWFRKRKQLDKVSDMKRLCDTSWNFVFYIAVSSYGFYVLWDKPWFSKTAYCWIGWPFQTVSNDIYLYYVVELGYYISYLYLLFTDHKRKDFMEFLVHHTVTITLLVLSWTFNLVRVGSIVLCIHDPVDNIISIAKAAHYCKKSNFADVFFALFLVTWIISRLFIYPYVVLYTVYIELSILADDSSPYLQYLNASLIGHFLRALLVVLQIIHVFWTVYLLKAAALKLKSGKLQDFRSDTEEDEKDNEEFQNMLNGNNNFVNS